MASCKLIFFSSAVSKMCGFKEIRLCVNGPLSCCCRVQTSCMNPLVAETTESPEILCSVWTRQHDTLVDLQISTPPPPPASLLLFQHGEEVIWQTGDPALWSFLTCLRKPAGRGGTRGRRFSRVVVMQEVAVRRSSTVAVEGWRWSAVTLVACGVQMMQLKMHLLEERVTRGRTK